MGLTVHNQSNNQPSKHYSERISRSAEAGATKNILFGCVQDKD